MLLVILNCVAVLALQCGIHDMIISSIGDLFNALNSGMDNAYRLGSDNLIDKTSSSKVENLEDCEEFRQLKWGDINFLHTTDTHGWLGGHILEPEFNGDWGDFVSFGERMRNLADAKGVDLLLVDSGDRYDGNGLSDASAHSGNLSIPIFSEQDYDVVTVGNHELYREEITLHEFHTTRKRYGDRYVVSNVEVAHGSDWVPLGNKFRLFQTKNRKLNVLALGFLFNFEGNNKKASKVTKVEDELKKPWFQEVLHEILPTLDLILVVSHIPARDYPELDHILAAIRSVNSTIPVHMFGGHSHIRDYKVYDDYAVALQSGRYVETIGWGALNFTKERPQFSRTYIDFNRRSMAFHAELDLENLLTEHGQKVSHQIAKARKALDLDQYLADVPQSYYTDRAPFPDRKSIFSLIQEKILPLLSSPPEVINTTRYIFLNTGGVRFDLMKGPYTKDSGYILSPFLNDWVYIGDIPRNIADSILNFLNNQDQVLYMTRYSESLKPSLKKIEKKCPKASLGYVTHDDLGNEGDDMVHKPWQFYPLPNALQTIIDPNNSEFSTLRDKSEQKTDRVTIIFQDFLGSFIRNALIAYGHEEMFNPVHHGGPRIIDLIPEYLNSL